MTSGLQITCANKNPNGTIVRIGGSRWSMSLHEAIFQLTSYHLRFHIFIGDTSYNVGVRGDGQSSYLVLEPDGKPLADIEGLFSC